eukprot:maker-scaffold_2-snap-gene-23.5-mRNA-1 protein AED:0.02 eAED:0.02 QI:62/0.6/0.5/0.83/1/1/6/0/336
MEEKIRNHRLTSMQLFKLFIKRTENKELKEVNIISKDCFNLWVSSRLKKLKQPLPSFRRTLCAHLRGADDRIPFPEDVEQELLSSLRKTDADGFPVDCFEPISGKKKTFRKNKKGIWITGYEAPYGFHENKKTDKENQQIITQFGRIDTIPKITSLVSGDELDVLSREINVHKTDLLAFKTAAEKHNISFFGPAVTYLLRHAAEKSRYFNETFVLPDISQCFFRKDMPIGLHVINFQTKEIMYKDECAEKIFGNLQHGGGITRSITEFLNLMRIVTPYLGKYGACWTRVTTYVNGVRYPLLSYIRAVSDTREEVHFQVQMDCPLEDDNSQFLLIVR